MCSRSMTSGLVETLVEFTLDNRYIVRGGQRDELGGVGVLFIRDDFAGLILSVLSSRVCCGTQRKQRREIVQVT
jgi:hypothetical protein